MARFPNTAANRFHQLQCFTDCFSEVTLAPRKYQLDWWLNDPMGHVCKHTCGPFLNGTRSLLHVTLCLSKRGRDVSAPSSRTGLITLSGWGEEGGGGFRTTTTKQDTSDLILLFIHPERFRVALATCGGVCVCACESTK